MVVKTDRASVAARIFFLSEDGSSKACETLAAVALRICRKIEPSLRLEQLELAPFRVTREQRALLTGAAWKGAKRNTRTNTVYIQFLRSIAEELLWSDRLVVWHVDGDVCWEDRGKSENAAKFKGLIETDIEAILRDRRAQCRPPPELSVVGARQRLLLLLPFYSIEAWLYQNDARLRELCVERGALSSLETIRAWSSDRGLLDEIEKIADAFVLGRTCNHDLATSMTVAVFDAVIAANKSLSENYVRWRDNPEVRQVLARTHLSPEAPR